MRIHHGKYHILVDVLILYYDMYEINFYIFQTFNKN